MLKRDEIETRQCLEIEENSLREMREIIGKHQARLQELRTLKETLDQQVYESKNDIQNTIHMLQSRKMKSNIKKDFKLICNQIYESGEDIVIAEQFQSTGLIDQSFVPEVDY